MKKIFLLLAAACVTLSAAADEGMWMLPYLQKMNSKDMKARGCKLSAEEIYSMNNSSLKDAIVIFGGGCTGEIVSPDGLLFTNHHCGYGSIQSLSSVEHDYLKNGFWAMSRAEELPAPGLKVRFIRRIVDVTPDVLGAVPDIAGGGEREELVAGQVKAVSERLAGENPGMDVEIKSFFGGNQYFAFVIEVFRDVRLVGAPPTSIGKFGGDTDNWMWPRHTGDFSVFRVYAGPDNRPADYSPENRPYKAEKFLKISLGGYDEGDFAMIMGFPGSTQRYMTSYEIDRLLEVENPQRIFIRGERQAILKEDMAASAKVRIQYASKYAQSSNYWKNSIGKSRGIRRLDVKGRKQEQEAAFTAWAAKNTLPTEGYSNALNLIRESVEETAPYFASSQYLSEAIGRSVEILAPARLAVSKKGGELTEALKAFYKHFMAETAKVLCPEKKVLIPCPEAGCSLAESCDAGEFAAFKAKYPGHTVVSYVNTTVGVKALTDICCTSSNALKVVESIPADQPVIFAPDRNLGSYIQKLTGRRNMVLWDGACHVHEEFSLEKLLTLKREHPAAKVVVHPECRAYIVEVADYVGSTAGILEYCGRSDAQEFIVVTEAGILAEMKRRYPEKEFIPAPPDDETCGCNNCKYMKMVTLENICACLENESPEIVLDDEVRRAAERSILNMINVK